MISGLVSGAVVWLVAPGFAIIAACVGASVIGGRVERRWLDRRRRARLEAGSDELPVTVVLSAEERTLGTDAGTLVLVDGWLLFRGERTEWSLRAPGPPGWIYGAPGGPISIWFDASDQDRLDRLLDAWRRSPVPDGDPILPPDRPDPVIRAAARPTTVAAIGLIAVTVAATLFITRESAAVVGAVVSVVALLAIRKARRDDRILLRYRNAPGEEMEIAIQEDPPLLSRTLTKECQ